MKSNVVFRPTVVIGLGGTGHGAVLKLKKRFMDAYGSVPPIVRFLAFDTTENVEHTEHKRDGSPVSLEPNNERIVLSIPNPAALVSGNNPHIDKWWPSNIPIGAIIAGAGQVRARGRLALFAKSNDIFARVRNAIDRVNDIKNNKQMYDNEFDVSSRGGVEVYIVGSLAGGTGSGTFFDMSVIARSFLDSFSHVTGVLVLPRVFTGLPGTSLVRPNAYGALKEVERFSHFTNADRFSIDYGKPNQADVARSPFDLLYLIDSINEDGKVVGETNDLMNIVADGLYIQIGSQIGTNSENATDNIATQLEVLGRVKGRSAKYCSFGVASLALPTQQYEVMMVEDARKLLHDGLLTGLSSDAELESEVVSFVKDSNLKEDDADDVIDALSEREGGGQLRFPISLGQMKFDNTALTAIQQLHSTHFSKIERQIAQRLEDNYKRVLADTLRAIDAWWEKDINRPNGLTHAMSFVEKLLIKLAWYQNMMEGESKEEQEKLKALTFKIVEDQIKEAAAAWTRRESKTRTACEQYKGLVDRRCDLHLQVARRDKAAALYGAVRTHVEGLKLKLASIRVKVEASLREWERRFLDVSTRRGGESPFEMTVQFDTEGNRPKILPDDFFQWFQGEHRSLATWTDVHEEDVSRDIENFIRQRYRPLLEMPIDDVLRRCDVEEVSQDLNQLQSLAVPLWRYDEGKIPVVNRQIIQEMYHYGVMDAAKTVLKDEGVFNRVPRGATDPSIVSTLDPQRITLFKVKLGVPLFALQGTEEMERSYMDPDKIVSNHIHRDWESFPNLIPRVGEGDALRWFAIAQAPEPFEIITRKGDWYYIRSQYANMTDNGEMRLGQGRLNAFQSFEKNRDLIKEVEEKVEVITRTRGQDEITKILRDYIERVKRQVSTGKVDDSIKEQIEGELKSVDDYLRNSATIR